MPRRKPLALPFTEALAAFERGFKSLSIWVSVDPGDMELHRIPYRANSKPRHLVRCIAAALLAQYAAIRCLGTVPAFEAIVTIDPLRRALINGRAAFTACMILTTLTEKA
jgi:hypothetical protein